MNCLILLHSTTGNTRLVTRYARAHLEREGHVCTIHDVVRHGEPPSLEGVDLLGVAGPTMYWRPTYVMERAVARLPSAAPGAAPPVFLLATAGGDPGSHFALLAELLAHKGFITVGAHFTSFPNNWPTHRAVMGPIAWAEPYAERFARQVPGARPALSVLWPDVADASPRAPAKIEAFLDRIVATVERARRDGAAPKGPAPEELYQGVWMTKAIGRLMDVSKMRLGTRISIDPNRCSRCYTCVLTCPVGCVAREGDGAPSVGATCTGCWACYNACPEGAISGFGARAGAGQYRGPTKRAREIFSRRGDDDAPPP